MRDDTIRLLGECDAGISMAISALDEVLTAAEDPHLRKTLHQSKAAHRDLQTKTRPLLREHHAPGKKRGATARGMSWRNTNVQLAVRPGDGTVADLVVTGCNMGVKNLHRYQNRYRSADCPAKNVADDLIGLEADLANSMFPYL